MKRLEIVGLKACPHCHRAIAYLMSEDGEHTLGIALDACRAREISRDPEDPGREKFLTDLLTQLLASSSCTPRQAVLDWNEKGFLMGRIDLTTEIISCSPQEAVALVVAAGIPFYAGERVFEHLYTLHPPDVEGERTEFIQPKPKPTLH